VNEQQHDLYAEPGPTTARELAPITPQPLATPTPSAAQILQAAIDGGITKENVEVVERLAAMAERANAQQAKLAFNRAMFALRKAMPAFPADKEVMTKSGAKAYEYCSPDEIKARLEPLLSKAGFFTTTDQTLGDGQARVTLRVTHRDGHSEDTHYAVRVSPGTQIMSPSQCDAAATTFAERHAIIKAFNIRTRVQDSQDPHNVGEYVSEEQATELFERVDKTHSDDRRFLRVAGVTLGEQITIDDYRRIPAGRYDELSRMLATKERAGQ
jgi:hypothetical protein